jgi:precorrin-3B C17-methyltransferase
MNGGRLDILGLGAGTSDWMTAEAPGILERATDLVGYGPYLDRIVRRDGQVRHASDNRVEIDRAKLALGLAAAGRRVVIVSGGDPGIFAMAAAVFEAIESGDCSWRNLDIVVHPGVTAMLAVAARLGAPLGHDFSVISLSDNLKPWAVIERRLRASAEADFVMVFYNPASQARPRRIHETFALLRTLKQESTVVVFARAVGRSDERIMITTLGEADPSVADMNTLVLVGSSQTRSLDRTGGYWIYTPRTYRATE